MIFLSPDNLFFRTDLLSVLIWVQTVAKPLQQFGPRSGLTEHRYRSESKQFDTLRVFLKEYFENVNFEKFDTNNAYSYLMIGLNFNRLPDIELFSLWNTNNHQLRNMAYCNKIYHHNHNFNEFTYHHMGLISTGFPTKSPQLHRLARK